NAPWALLPEKLIAMAEVLSLRMQGIHFTAEEIKARIGAPPQRMRRQSGSVAVLPLIGVLAQRANLVTNASGGTSMEQFAAVFRQAISDDAIKAVVIEVDSPGGSVHGTEELARQIFDARGSKPIIAIANSLAASGSLWIGSQADEFVITPGGLVGSIGIVAEHVDASAHEEKEGLKTTLVSTSKFKTEGNPFEPLSDDARRHMESVMAGFHTMFVGDVARGRGVTVDKVQEDVGQGRVMGAKAAVKAGLVDRIATFEQVLARLSATPDTAQRVEAQAEPLSPEARARSERLWDIALMGRGGMENASTNV
ncbi:hypothetical protein LCGC14_1212430, partial [marine sediment metagenome]